MELGDTANVSERRQSWLQFMFGIGSVKTSKLYLNYIQYNGAHEEALLYITLPRFVEIERHTS